MVLSWRMNNSALFPKVDAQKWAHLYNLEIKTVPCQKCGELQTLNVPIAFGTKRGFQAELHSCGPRYQPFTYTTVDPKELELYAGAFSILGL